MEDVMGITYTEITLKNAGDVVNVKRGFIKEQDVRETTVSAMVDTGAGTLVITEVVCKQLGLEIQSLRNATVTGGGKAFCKVTSPVTIYWKDRFSFCNALVVPGETTVLLGAIPLEDLDLIVNPVKKTVEGAYGDEVLMLIK
jgi:clan AA aspartic protease